MIILKSKEEIEIMRESGKITGLILKELTKFASSGKTTQELNDLAEEIILNNKAKPAFKGYRGFPKTITVSINEEVVHGIPGERVLKEGDLVSIDVGVIWRDYCSDGATSFIIGKSQDKKIYKLLEITKTALMEGISQVRKGNRLYNISYSIQKYVESNGFSVVRDLVGHGIGKTMHEEPQIPNFGIPNTGIFLDEGMVLAIEPMVNIGDYKVTTKEDNWTVVTLDNSLSAHFEHTVAITNNGPFILTLP